MGGEGALIGLDLGTTGLKAAGLFEDKIFFSCGEPMEYSSDGVRVEFDAEGLCQKVLSLIARVASHMPEGASCKGVAISSAGGNTVLAGADNRPLAPAISWRDRRQNGEASAVLGDWDSGALYRLLGWPFRGMFPLGHLCWLYCHERELLRRAAKVAMSADYVNFRLTGRWAVDRSTAASSMLLDQVAGRWHRPFLEKLDLTEASLPAVGDTGDLVGGLTREAASAAGLPENTPVYLGSFDHPSAARGAGVLEEGSLMLSCGTSWVCYLPFRDREQVLSRRMLCDPFLSEEGLWAGMRSLTDITGKIDALLSGRLPDVRTRYRRFDSLAASAEAGAGGLLLNPMDEPDPESLACWDDGALARAIMEGTGYALKARVEELVKSGVEIRDVTMVGGPSRTEPWPQIICDILELPMRTVNGAYAGAAGAAAVAGVSAGVYGSIREAGGRIARSGRQWEPCEGRRPVYRAGYDKFLRMGERSE